jgi:hypothetical protein
MNWLSVSGHSCFLERFTECGLEELVSQLLEIKTKFWNLT